MKRKLSYFLILGGCAAFGAACSSGHAASDNRETVVIADKRAAGSNKEVFIDDKMLESKETQPIKAKSGLPPETRIAGDKSEIAVMFDGQGNKTETRFFKDHPRLKLIVIRTDADGGKKIHVYGFSNEVKTLPDELTDRALTAPGDEIANAAGLYETRSLSSLPNYLKKSTGALQPQPSSIYPLQPAPDLYRREKAEQEFPVQPDDDE